MSPATTAVLLLAYGTPERLEDVAPYFTHIRGGRTPSPEAVARLRQRYERVGGRTPLLDITREVGARLEAELERDGEPVRVYVGMKHWHPFIADTMRRIAGDGIERVTVLVLAPHYSRLSIGGYRAAVEDAHAALGRPFAIRFIERWGSHPDFVALIASRIRWALADLAPDERGQVVTVFSAHSLPERIRSWGDPYEAELLESSAAAARAAGIGDWRFAWQSAGETGEPWLGPDILDYLETLRAEGVRQVLQVPIGFVSDHLEILYDLDLEARARAAALGLGYRRTALPNASPDFVRTLAAVIRSAAPVAA
ncbi:MAG TPA: ferrochelatase [Gemmatimonadales bacterium]|nr:ferrochelatase [Gemmatimonadales bacterium]